MSSIPSLTQFDFYPTLAQTNGLSLVYFSAHACSSCKHLGTLLAELATENPTLSIFKVDAQQDQALVSEYEVFHLPALFLFKDGQFHAPLECEARIPSILAAIEHAVAQPAREAP